MKIKLKPEFPRADKSHTETNLKKEFKMGKCPRCGNQVKVIKNTFVCECGWTHSKKEEASQKPVIVGMLLSFTLLVGLLLHFFEWGSYGLGIFFASSEDKVEICMDLKKYDCVEKNYEKIYKSSKSLEDLEKLAEFQFKLEKYDKSAKNYSVYFEEKGSSYKAAYYHAHALVKLGDIDAAITFFDAILSQRPKTLMITVMESYLDILVSHNRLQKAKQVLDVVSKVSKGSRETENQIQAWRKKYKI